MLGYYPTPYPDELFYSVCARYASLIGYDSIKTVNADLWGKKHARTPAYDFPTGLETVVSRLPPGYSLSVKQLREKHTLFPLYQMFLPDNRLNRIKDKAIRSEPIVPISYKSHATISQSYFQYCPVCSAEQKGKFGECYWMRIHQIPGVKVCPIHAVWLETSNLKIRNMAYVTAERDVCVKPARNLDEFSPIDSELLAIARDYSWLLTHKLLSYNEYAFNEKYYALFNQKGFVSSGKIQIRELSLAFQLHFGNELLNILNCQIDPHDVQNWIRRIVRRPNTFFPPLYHIILSHFLGLTINEIIEFSVNMEVSLPFGSGPWPCLNPVCKHYRERVIEKYEVDKHFGDEGRIRGVFSCKCGYIYSRFGPDQHPDDIYTRTRVLSYGTDWEEKFYNLWNDTNYSVSEIGKQLGAKGESIRSHATRLGLPNPRLNVPEDALRERAKLKAKRARYQRRTDWMYVFQENFNIDDPEIIAKVGRAYLNLLKNDRKWLNEHLLGSKETLLPLDHPLDNWQQLDDKYIQYIEIMYHILINRPRRPLKITVSSLERGIAIRGALSQNLDKLPKTVATFSILVESDEKFALRKVQWAKDQFCKRKLCPNLGDFVRYAAVQQVISNPNVELAVKNALTYLANTFGNL